MARVGETDDCDKLENYWFVTKVERGKKWFLQPCPNYRDDECRIYDYTSKPFICSDFKCILLKNCREDEMDWDDARKIILKTKEMIRIVKSGLGSSGRDDAPPSLNERLKTLEMMAESEDFRRSNTELLLKARELALFFEHHFKGEKE